MLFVTSFTQLSDPSMPVQRGTNAVNAKVLSPALESAVDKASSCLLLKLYHVWGSLGNAVSAKHSRAPYGTVNVTVTSPG